MQQLRNSGNSQAESRADFDARMKELRESQAKTDAQLAKTDAQLAKTDAQLAKTDVQLAKTDAQLAKTDAQLAKTDAQLEKTSRKLDSVSEQLAAIGINTGQSAEEFFFRSVSKTLNLAGIQFDKIERNVQLSDDSPEYDIVLYNGKHVMIMEVKYKAHPDEVGDLAIRKTESFRKFYPQYKNHELHFGIASKITNDTLIKSARKEKIFLITQQGDHITVANGQVRTW